MNFIMNSLTEEISKKMKLYYGHSEKHNNNITCKNYKSDLRRDWWIWKPNKQEIEKNIWYKVNISSLRVKNKTYYILDFKQ